MHGILDIPADLVPVSALLTESLARVEKRFDDQLASDLPAVSRLVTHVEHYRGKMLRPALAILSALAGRADTEPRVTGEVVTVAAVCEMVHMATLVHDDVLDEADTRRRGQTLNRLYGNEAAVILGDYLIASAFHLCSELADQSVSLEVARVSTVLCGGELLQLHNRERWSIDEATYSEILERKTGSLIAAAARLGAHVAGAGIDASERLGRFGVRLGVAFQIQDDLLDLLGDERTVGKSVGKDVQKGKLTYPLIHHLAHAEPIRRGRTLILLESIGRRGEVSPDEAQQLVDAVRSTDSIAAARAKAESLVAEAVETLGALPPSPARSLLELMAGAVVDRSY